MALKSVHDKLETILPKRLCNHTEESFRLRSIMYLARWVVIAATAQAKPEVRP